MVAVHHLDTHGWCCDALIHDGCLLRHRTDHARAPTRDELAPLTEIIEEQVGIPGIRFEIKQMECLQDLDFTAPAEGGQPPLPPLQNVRSEREAAAALLETSKEYVRKLASAEFMVLNPHTRTWELQNKAGAIACVYSMRVVEARLLWPDKPDSATHHQNVAPAERIAKLMLDKMPPDTAFPEQLQRASRDRLFYANGYWDFQSASFETHESADVITPTRIATPFPAHPGEAAMEEIKRRVWNAIFPREDECQAMLTFLARGLAGRVNDEVWAAMIGERNCGKSAMTDALKAAFGPYVEDFSGRHLMNKPGSSDAARDFTFAMPFEHARLAIANELPTEGHLNGTTMKQITSGGDRVSARKLYNDARNFVPKARILLCGNRLPEMQPDDARKTMARFKCRTEFVDGELTADHLATNSEYERGESEYRLGCKDLGIKDYLSTDMAIAACTHLVLGAFRDIGTGTASSYLPATVLDDSDAASHVTLDMTITEFLEATGDIGDAVLYAEIMAEVRRRTNNNVSKKELLGEVNKLVGGEWTLRKVEGGPTNKREQMVRFVRKRVAE